MKEIPDHSVQGDLANWLATYVTIHPYPEYPNRLFDEMSSSQTVHNAFFIVSSAPAFSFQFYAMEI